MRGLRIITGLGLGILIAAASAGAQDTYGITATSYVTLGPQDLQPENAGISFVRDYGLSTSAGNFWATVHLPSGAVVTTIALDFCDDDGGMSPYFGYGILGRHSDEHGGGFKDSQAIAAGCTTLTLDTSASVVPTIKNDENRLVVEVAVASPVHINGFVIGYKLQVSPAPASATFADVPTSDFGFQYVEALVAAGVTGGCGVGKYCPDAFVTRRQMAIFIAKSLGLHWP